MISVIIPIFNEEENISNLYNSIIEALKEIGFEVLFINDGSSDDSEKPS